MLPTPRRRPAAAARRDSGRGRDRRARRGSADGSTAVGWANSRRSARRARRRAGSRAPRKSTAARRSPPSAGSCQRPPRRSSSAVALRHRVRWQPARASAAAAPRPRSSRRTGSAGRTPRRAFGPVRRRGGLRAVAVRVGPVDGAVVEQRRVAAEARRRLAAASGGEVAAVVGERAVRLRFAIVQHTRRRRRRSGTRQLRVFAATSTNPQPRRGSNSPIDAFTSYHPASAKSASVRLETTRSPGDAAPSCSPWNQRISQCAPPVPMPPSSSRARPAHPSARAAAHVRRRRKQARPPRAPPSAPAIPPVAGASSASSLPRRRGRKARARVSCSAHAASSPRAVVEGGSVRGDQLKCAEIGRPLPACSGRARSCRPPRRSSQSAAR